MYCSQCGGKNPDDAKFCTYCGERLLYSRRSAETEQETAPAENASAAENEVTPVYSDSETGEYDAPVTLAPELSPMKMGWHKFLIYFALILGALTNMGSAYQILTGEQYGENKEYVYSVFSGMKTLDAAYGVILLGIAAFCIYVRFQLAHFKRRGPAALTILYICSIGFSFLYLLIGSAVSGVNLIDASVVGQVVGPMIVALISINYYRKRRFLFVN